MQILKAAVYRVGRNTNTFTPKKKKNNKIKSWITLTKRIAYYFNSQNVRQISEYM